MRDEKRDNCGVDSNGGQGTSRRSRRKDKQRKAGFKVESLEQRILMSATWADAHSGEHHDGATSGDDQFTGDNGADVADGGAGNDDLTGKGGVDTLHGGDGHDLLKGDGGNDTLFGDDGNDTIRGGSGVDTVSGGAGNDQIYGDGGNDTIHGDAGDDLIKGGSGADTINGDAGDDTLYGQGGDDRLHGGDGHDTLHGGSGADEIHGGGGNDILYGESGNDTFHFDGAHSGDVYKVSGGANSDTIDLSAHDSSHITLSHGRIDVALSDGGSFSIHHSGVEKIVTADNPNLTADTHSTDSAMVSAANVQIAGAKSGAGSDTGAESDTASDSDTETNTGPVADAGADMTVDEGAQVTLHGEHSFDWDAGDTLTHHWVQTGGPTVSLDDPHAAHPTSTAPEGVANTDVAFELHVSDGQHTTVDSVVVHVNADDDAPVADAGADHTVDEGQTVQLHAAAADADTDSSHLSYEWVQTAGPTVHLDDPNSATPSFTAPEGVANTDVTFELHVSDGHSTSIDTVAIHVNADDDAPSADAGADQHVAENAVVQLSGAGADQDSPGVTYTWVQTGGPSVTLSDPHAANPTFTAPNVATDTPVTFELHVSDGHSTSVDTVAVHVAGVNDGPVADAGADQYVHEGATVALSAAGSHDADADDHLTYTWTQTGGPAVSMNDPHAASPTFTAPGTTGITKLTFQVQVTDSHGATHMDTVEIAVGDPAVEAYVHGLNYTQFRNLDANQADYLTPAQIATIPNSDWMATIPAATRASFDATQIHAIDTSRVSIGYLTADQRESLTDGQVKAIGYTDFRYLSATGVDHLSPAQIATIPNSDWFATMSADARGSLDASQVQGLNTAKVSIGYLNADQRESLTDAQIKSIGYTDFRYLSATGVDHLSPAQIATIPNSDWFATMSADARGSLDASQVQALNTAKVSIGYLNADQRESLTDAQIKSIGHTDFRYLSATGVDHLSPAQIATIPNSDWFATMSASARGSLDESQVQGLNTSKVSIGYLTADQRESLTDAQIKSIGYTDFRYLSATGVDHLSPAQVATIPNSDWFATMSADARGSLNASQVQGLNTAKVSIGYLNADQRESLTDAQIKSIGYTDFRYLSATGVDHLSPAQIATIPNSDWFATMSASARGSLDESQVQGLNTSKVSIGYLTADQRESLTDAQIKSIGYTDFRYLSANGVDHLSPAQVATIPNSDWFATMSADARASLDAAQVQALNTANVSIGYLTPAQRLDLSTAQVQSLSYTQLRYVPAARIPELTTAQMQAIPNSDWFNTLSADQKDALTFDQIRALKVGLSGVVYNGTDNADTLTGNTNVNRIIGGAGADNLSGGTGNDVLEGGAGNDTLDGGAGRDLLIGGGGNDNMSGGAGNDTFAFENAKSGDSYTVNGGSETDTLDLRGYKLADVEFENGKLTVHTADGGSFTVTHQNIETAQFADGAVAIAYNTAPVIDAGPEQTVDEGAPVQLTAYASDAQGDSLSYTWVQTAGPTVTLDDPHAAKPEFVAPEGVANTDITFELRVSDGKLTSTDTVTVHVNADDDAPSADAGPDQLAAESTLVQLNASAADVEGQDVTYHWVQTSGPAVTLSDPQALNPTFTAPEGVANTDVKFELHVSDGHNESIDTVTIHVNALDDAPSADAGQDLTADENATVQLHGEAGDVDSPHLSYEWVQTGGPAVQLSDPHAASPSFTAPEGVANTDVAFELRVSDGNSTSVDSVTVHVNADDDAPSADAGADQQVHENQVVQISAHGGDAEGQALRYEWIQTAGPQVQLSDSHAPNPTFVAPQGTHAADVKFELRVSDGTNTSVDTVTIHVTAIDDAPTVSAGFEQTVEEGAAVQLTSSAADVENQDLTYEWVQTGGPAVVLSDPHSATPTFTAPEGVANTDVTFELRVSDGNSTSVDTVAIHVNADDDAPVADAGEAQTVAESAIVQLSASAGDADSPHLTYEWVQTGGPAVQLSDPHAASPSFTAPEGVANTDVAFELRVSDGNSTSVDTVVIHVNADDDAPSAQASAPPSVNADEQVQLAATAGDIDSPNLTMVWTQQDGPPVQISDPHAANPTFVSPDVTEPTVLRFQVAVSDGASTSIDTVDVLVNPTPSVAPPDDGAGTSGSQDTPGHPSADAPIDPAAPATPLAPTDPAQPSAPAIPPPPIPGGGPSAGNPGFQPDFGAPPMAPAAPGPAAPGAAPDHDSGGDSSNPPAGSQPASATPSQSSPAQADAPSDWTGVEDLRILNASNSIAGVETGRANDTRDELLRLGEESLAAQFRDMAASSQSLATEVLREIQPFSATGHNHPSLELPNLGDGGARLDDVFAETPLRGAEAAPAERAAFSAAFQGVADASHAARHDRSQGIVARYPATPGSAVEPSVSHARDAETAQEDEVPAVSGFWTTLWGLVRGFTGTAASAEDVAREQQRRDESQRRR